MVKRSRFGNRMGKTGAGARKRSYRIGYNSRFGSRYSKGPSLPRTTAMPYLKLHNNPVPRSLAYPYLPETFRARMKQTWVRPVQITSSGSGWVPFKIGSIVLSLDSDAVGLSDTTPFEFKKLMGIYKTGIVDYATYRVSVTELGFGTTATVATTTNLNGNDYNTGASFSSAILSYSDYLTFTTTGQSTSQNFADTVPQVPGGRLSTIHARGNQDTVTHFHSIDLASWFKFPTSKAQSVVSRWPNTAPTNGFPTITYPEPTNDDPVMMAAIEPLFGTTDDGSILRYNVTLVIEYHVSFSGLHMPAYAQASG